MPPANVICMLAFAAVASVANAQGGGLFSGPEVSLGLEAIGAEEQRGTFQRRTVRIDFAQLEAARDDVEARRSARLLLNLFDGVSFHGIVERATSTSGGYALSGRLRGIPFGSLALVVNGDVVMGKVRAGNAVYSIRTAGGVAVIERASAGSFREHPPLKPVAAGRRPAAQTDAGQAARDDGAEIDVFVVWTHAARTDAGGTRLMRTAVDLAVVETNDAYAASGAVQRIRLVGAVEANYEETGRLPTDLDRLLDPADGYLDYVHDLRDAYAADLVHLVLSGTCGGGFFEGIAVAMEEVSADFAPFAFSLAVFCDPLNLSSGLDTPLTGLRSSIFAHELGHNMGLQHDRYARYTTLNKPYPYSHGYVNQRAFEEGAEPEARWRTVMAYDDQCDAAGFRCRSLMRFSNPNQRYPDRGDHRLGTPGDEPSDDVNGPADAVRSLDDTRRVVANFRRSETRCTYRLARADVTVPADVGSYSIGVATSDECPYAARSHDGFLSVTSGSSSGAGEVRYQVASNDGDARVGVISVAGETLVVRQAGIRAFAGVCGRTPAIRDAITAWAGRDHCGAVTEFDLSEIPYLLLEGRGMTALRAGDFAGLSSLRTLSLGENAIAGTLPQDIGGLRSLVRLDLFRNQVTGPIPPELGRLQNLERLDLSFNELQGAIPEALAGLTKLRSLNLRDNRLTSTVPAWLAKLPDLGGLSLQNNQLRGPVPSALGRITGLAGLSLANNALTGSVPAELTDLARLHWLELAGNPLTGCIPGALRAVGNHDLDALELAYCAAVGIAGGGFAEAPEDGGRVREGNAAVVPITVDPAQDTAFEVTVAIAGGGAFGVVEGKRTLEIPPGSTAATLTVETADDQVEEPDGSFTATVLPGDDHAVFASRSSARILVDDDEGPSAPTIVSLAPEDGSLTVTWTMPSDDGGAPVVAYDIRHRPSAPGSTGQVWTRLPSTTAGDLQRDIKGLTNRVEYDVQVRAVSEDGNGAWSEIVTGTPRPCPDGIEIGDCRTLLAVREQLEGGGALNWAIERPIDEWAGVVVDRDTKRVLQLYLPRRGLTGTIPRELADLSGLGSLYLHDNSLEGSIPAELGSLTNLRALWLGGNRLTGEIPPHLRRLANLEELRLSRNRLAGEIPPSFGDLANLVAVWLHGNELGGTIPAEIGRLFNLQGLRLDGNRLTGTIPAELGRLAALDSLNLSDNQLTGAIPRTLSNLAGLSRLFLAGNSLTGCLPSALRDVDRNDVDALGLPDCPPARVVNLLIQSTPQDGVAYGLGERIEASVEFETDVIVTGAPRLAVAVGPDVRESALLPDRGNGLLVFYHDVVPEDRDVDGISIAPSALSLNGGVIRDADGHRAVLDLGLHAISNDRSHKVRGALRELVPDQELDPGGDAVVLDLARYFDVPEGGALTYAAPTVSDPTLVTAVLAGGLLTVVPHEGVATVTIAATNGDGVTMTLQFKVTVTLAAGHALVALFPNAGEPMLEGFVRVINHSAETGEVTIEAMDDTGVRAEPVRLGLAADAAAHFNSADLEHGNAAKGLAGGIGPGNGDWLLQLDSDLDVEVLSYIRTRDGFLTAMHDRVRASASDGAYEVVTLNPASNSTQVSRLRIVNPNAKAAAVSIIGVDDSGASSGTAVRFDLPAGQASAFTSSDLELGTGIDGALGDGRGTWRLTVRSDRPVIVMSLMAGSSGCLTNLSTRSPGPGHYGNHLVPVFPSAADARGREGLVRVVNRSGRATQVTVKAYDESGRAYEPLALAVGAGETVHFNSHDLEVGDVGRGLAGSTGPGEGDWWLELSATCRWTSSPTSGRRTGS